MKRTTETSLCQYGWLAHPCHPGFKKKNRMRTVMWDSYYVTESKNMRYKMGLWINSSMRLHSTPWEASDSTHPVSRLLEFEGDIGRNATIKFPVMAGRISKIKAAIIVGSAAVDNKLRCTPAVSFCLSLCDLCSRQVVRLAVIYKHTEEEQTNSY